MSDTPGGCRPYELLATVGISPFKVEMYQFDGFLGLAVTDPATEERPEQVIVMDWITALTLGAVLTLGAEMIRDLVVRGGPGSASLSTLFPWHEVPAGPV